MSDGFITSIAPTTFDRLPKLESLYLQNSFGNSWSQDWGGDGILRREAFSELGKLKVLVLSNNRIKGVEKGAFAALGNLKKLDLSGNILCGSTERCDESLVLSGAFDGLKSLEELYLGGNTILGTLKSDLFADLVKLKTLHVQGCRLGSFEAGTLWSQPELLSLDLSRNRIGNLDDDVFKKSTELEQLDLSRNQLEQISAGLMAP
eukprot:3007291-Rhodomonas_salina.1